MTRPSARFIGQDQAEGSCICNWPSGDVLTSIDMHRPTPVGVESQHCVGCSTSVPLASNGEVAFPLRAGECQGGSGLVPFAKAKRSSKIHWPAS